MGIRKSVVFTFILFTTGCAHRFVGPMPVVVDESKPETGGIITTIPDRAKETVDNPDFRYSVRKVDIDLSSAEISVVRTKHAHGLKTRLIKGGKSCSTSVVQLRDVMKVFEPSTMRVLDETNELRAPYEQSYGHEKETVEQLSRAAWVLESIDPDPVSKAPVVRVPVLLSQAATKQTCKYGIDLSLESAAELHIHLRAGSVSVEDWDEAIAVHLGEGEVSVNNVLSLSAVCHQCTLTGNEVKGPLSFAIESGNVGFIGLHGSVSGETLGDVVLQWHRLPDKDAAIQVHARAGDVILSFPEAAQISTETSSAVRGEVVSQVRSTSSGHPIVVTADLGNIKLLRTSKH